MPRYSKVLKCSLLFLNKHPLNSDVVKNNKCADPHAYLKLYVIGTVKSLMAPCKQHCKQWDAQIQLDLQNYTSDQNLVNYSRNTILNRARAQYNVTYL